MNPDLLNTLAEWAWRTSLEALPLAAAATVVWFWRGLPAAWRWWLPALFFVRLAMPLVPAAGWHPGSLAVSSASVAMPAAAALPVPAVSTPERHLPIVPVLWACGAGAVLVGMASSQWRLRRWLATAEQPAGQMLQREGDWAAARMGLRRAVPMQIMRGLPTLAVCGWWRPVLLVPEDLTRRFNAAQIRGMLLHEMAHVRRHDVLWTWCALGLCALHWFNPLAWLALRRFYADRELACDAAALRALDSSARHDYGEALLLCLQSPPAPVAPALASFFRRFPELKQRLQNIMNPTSPTIASRLFAALLVPLLVALSFTTAEAQRAGDAAKPDAATLCRRLYLDLSGRTPTPAEVDSFTNAAGQDMQAAISKLVIRLTAENPKAVRQEGEAARGPREGEQPRRMREGARDGEGGRKTEPRDGEHPKAGPRDGGQPRAGARDGERPREGARDGERPREGARDGERPREGARDGERPREGARDGEQPRKGPRDGEGAGAGPRDGDAARPAGEKLDAR